MPEFFQAENGGWAWCHDTHSVIVSPVCCRLFSPWSDLAFLWAGHAAAASVEASVVVTTDVSRTGWGAVSNRHAALRSWMGLQWHINFLELLALLLDLHQFCPLLQDKHVHIHTAQIS